MDLTEILILNVTSEVRGKYARNKSFFLIIKYWTDLKLFVIGSKFVKIEQSQFV